MAKKYELKCGICNKTIGYAVLDIPNDGENTIKYTISGNVKEPIRCVECERLREKNNDTTVVKVGEPIPYSDEINKAIEKGKLYKQGFDDAVRRLEDAMRWCGMDNDLISREDLKKALNYTYDCAYIDSKSKEGIVSDIIEKIDNAPTVSIKSCRECPFVADEEKQITNGDAWKSYCEGQEVGFKKAEDVFKRMKLVQETVDCIRYTFKQDTESDKLVRNCMALVQNAIDGEYHDMEEVDVSGLKRAENKWMPVSEGLPNLSDRYLVNTRYGEVMTDYFTGNHFLQGDDVIAWQPLPEAYKGGSAG